MDKSGRVIVMDFGIARTMVGAGMTNTGALIGTPDYMSPEQAMGEMLDARSDLFAMGIIFYELLTGQTPYESDTTMGKLWKRTSEPARPIGELDKTIPQPIAAIVTRCLNIDPEKRFAGAGEIVQAIEIWQGPGARTHVIIAGPAKLPALCEMGRAGRATARGSRGLSAAIAIRAAAGGGACARKRADRGF